MKIEKPVPVNPDTDSKTEFMKVAMLNAKLAHNALIEPHSLKLSTKFWLAVIILIVSFHVIVLNVPYLEMVNASVPEPGVV